MSKKLAEQTVTAKRKKKAVVADKKRVDSLVVVNERLTTEIEALSSLSKHRTTGTFQVPVSEEAEAVAVAVFSDAHIEERVDPRSVNGVNDYNLDIAQKRIEKFFTNVVRLLKKEQKDARITTLVLALLGDNFSGSIHEELLETNQLPPVEAALLAQDMIERGIRYILDNTDVNLVIPTNSGNHARLTKRIHVSTEYGNSLETYMYCTMAKHFAKEPRVTFNISTGYLNYVDIGGYTIAFHHGTFIRYLGGMGGPTISLNKAIAQWQKMRRADLYVQGHLHQFIDGGNFIINGSIIGYNAFALSIKASPEPPTQVFFLVDTRRKRKTVVIPVFLD